MDPLYELAQKIFRFKWYLNRYSIQHFIDDYITKRDFNLKWIFYEKYLKENSLEDTEETRAAWFDRNVD